MSLRCRLAAVGVAVVALLSGCAYGGPARETVLLGGHELRVWVADTPAAQSDGLNGFDGLAEGEGMLFVFDEPSDPAFVIKDVSFPIEVVFIAEDGRVSAIESLLVGDTGRVVTSDAPSVYVLEVPHGWCADNGVQVDSVFKRE